MAGINKIPQQAPVALEGIQLVSSRAISSIAEKGIITESASEPQSYMLHRQHSDAAAKKIKKSKELDLNKLSRILGIDLSKYDNDPTTIPTCKNILYKDGACYTGIVSSEIMTETTSAVPKTSVSFFHDFGRMKYPDGSIYTGEWSNGKRHGKGQLVDIHGNICKGVWNHGRLHGGGSLTVDGKTKSGIWTNNIFVPEGTPVSAKLPKPLLPLTTLPKISDSLDDPQLGLVRPYVRNGVRQDVQPTPPADLLATILSSPTAHSKDVNGKSFVTSLVMQINLEDGTIINGRYTGHVDKKGRANSSNGHFYGEDGSYYEGSFVKGVRDGKGVFVLPNGNNLHGSWKNGFLKNSVIKIVGKLDPSDEDSEIVVRKGYHKKGRLVGKGSLTLSSGEKISGKWHNNALEFEGKVVKTDPKTKKQEKGLFTLEDGFESSEKPKITLVENESSSIYMDTSRLPKTLSRMLSALRPSHLSKKDGDYTGEVDKKGRPHGKGVFIDEDDNAYHGEFRHGKIHGKGQLSGDDFVFYSNSSHGRTSRKNVSVTTPIDPNNPNSVLVTKTGSLDKSRTKFIGKGIIKFPSGEVFSGIWDRDGGLFKKTCLLTLSTGEKQKCVLKKDRFYPIDPDADPITEINFSYDSLQDGRTMLDVMSPPSIRKEGMARRRHTAHINFDDNVDVQEEDFNTPINSSNPNAQPVLSNRELKNFSHMGETRKGKNIFDPVTSKLHLGTNDIYSPAPKEKRSFPNMVAGMYYEYGIYTGQLHPVGKFPQGVGDLSWDYDMMDDDFDENHVDAADENSTYYKNHIHYYANSSYKGEFSEGAFEGQGVYTHNSTVVHRGAWFRGLPVITPKTTAAAIQNLSKYFPLFALDTKEGYYVGELDDKNRPHGRGEFHYVKNTKPIGIFPGHTSGGLKGAVYNGEWVHGIKDCADGALFSMSQRDAKASGLEQGDCIIYRGPWSNGLPHINPLNPMSSKLAHYLNAIQDSAQHAEKKNLTCSTLASPIEFWNLLDDTELTVFTNTNSPTEEELFAQAEVRLQRPDDPPSRRTSISSSSSDDDDTLSRRASISSSSSDDDDDDDGDNRQAQRTVRRQEDPAQRQDEDDDAYSHHGDEVQDERPIRRQEDPAQRQDDEDDDRYSYYGDETQEERPIRRQEDPAQRQDDDRYSYYSDEAQEESSVRPRRQAPEQRYDDEDDDRYSNYGDETQEESSVRPRRQAPEQRYDDDGASSSNRVSNRFCRRRPDSVRPLPTPLRSALTVLGLEQHSSLFVERSIRSRRNRREGWQSNRENSDFDIPLTTFRRSSFSYVENENEEGN